MRYNFFFSPVWRLTRLRTGSFTSYRTVRQLLQVRELALEMLAFTANEVTTELRRVLELTRLCFTLSFQEPATRRLDRLLHWWPNHASIDLNRVVFRYRRHNRP